MALPDRVKLSETMQHFTPVAGSIVRGLMYGADRIEQSKLSLLVPPREVQQICLQIDTRDGSYIGKSRFALRGGPKAQFEVALDGANIRKLASSKASAAVLAWVEPDGACDGPEPQSLLPAAWSSTEAPVTLQVVVNSGGHTVRLALEAGSTGEFRTTACEALPASPVSRVYDTVCKIRLCELAGVGSALVEVRNFATIVHRERLAIPRVNDFCR